MSGCHGRGMLREGMRSMSVRRFLVCHVDSYKSRAKKRVIVGKMITMAKQKVTTEITRYELKRSCSLPQNMTIMFFLLLT